MTTSIEIPELGITVTPTCDCGEPLHTTGGSVSWACWNDACPINQIPMWEDANFVDDEGTHWIHTDDGDWIDVAE